MKDVCIEHKLWCNSEALTWYLQKHLPPFHLDLHQRTLVNLFPILSLFARFRYLLPLCNIISFSIVSPSPSHHSFHFSLSFFPLTIPLVPHLSSLCNAHNAGRWRRSKCARVEAGPSVGKKGDRQNTAQVIIFKQTVDGMGLRIAIISQNQVGLTAGSAECLVQDKTDRKTQSLTVRVRDGAPDRQFASGSVLTHSPSLSPSSCCYSSGDLFVFCPNRDYESAVWGIERRDGIETADEMCDSQPGGGGGERKWSAEMRRFEKWQVRIKKGRRVRRKAVETGSTWWKSWKAFWTNRQRWKRKVYRKIYNLQGIIYTTVSSARPAPLHPSLFFSQQSDSFPRQPNVLGLINTEESGQV